MQNVKPDLIIAIDSLAARSVDRVCTTIQLADNGINPGSGIGNKRMGITRETMGVPVIALGVPTVVHASNIAYDVIETLLGQMKGELDLGIMGRLGEADKRQMIRAVLGSEMGSPRNPQGNRLPHSQHLPGAGGSPQCGPASSRERRRPVSLSTIGPGFLEIDLGPSFPPVLTKESLQGMPQGGMGRISKVGVPA